METWKEMFKFSSPHLPKISLKCFDDNIPLCLLLFLLLHLFRTQAHQSQMHIIFYNASPSMGHQHILLVAVLFLHSTLSLRPLLNSKLICFSWAFCVGFCLFLCFYGYKKYTLQHLYTSNPIPWWLSLFGLALPKWVYYANSVCFYFNNVKTSVQDPAQ